MFKQRDDHTQLLSTSLPIHTVNQRILLKLDMMQHQYLHTLFPHFYLFYIYFFSFGALHPKGPHIFFYQSRLALHPKGPHMINLGDPCKRHWRESKATFLVAKSAQVGQLEDASFPGVVCYNINSTQCSNS
jgi:hypothetical protein